MATFFELTLEDTSPVVNYYPFAETLGAPNLLAGWNSYFSESGFLSQLGETGTGNSSHITSLDGAVLTISWFGTGIRVFGSVSEATYQVSIDGATPSTGLPRQDVLIDFQGLQPKHHTIALIAHPVAATSNTSSFLAFDRAVLNISTNFIGASMSSEPVDATSSRWTFSGDWEELLDPGLATQPNQTYRVSSTPSDTASVSFTGSAVILTGMRNATHGQYNVTLDGTTTAFNGRSDWLEASTLFLQAGLDETTQHTLTVTNADNATLAISGINVTHISGGAPIVKNIDSGVSTAAIFGVVFAVTLGVVAVMIIFAWVYLRRRKYIKDRDFPANSPTPNLRSVRISRRGTYISQDPNTLPRHTTKKAQENRSDQNTVLLTNIDGDNIDPTTPLPYLRSSKTPSTAMPDGRDSYEQSQWENIVEENTVEENSGTYVRGSFAIHVHQKSTIMDASETLSPVRRVNSRAHRFPLPLRIEVPRLTSDYKAIQDKSPSPRMRNPSIRTSRSLLLTTPINKTGYSALPTVSTMKFGHPWDKDTEDEEGEANGTAEDVLDRSHGRAKQKAVGLSNWEPPW